jgi:hypothetical protein
VFSALGAVFIIKLSHLLRTSFAIRDRPPTSTNNCLAKTGVDTEKVANRSMTWIETLTCIMVRRVASESPSTPPRFWSLL